MGIYSLWDPWETHYGEVAREMLARDDWISLWWAQDGWFWSKPVLDMWMQAIAMATLGVHYQPDKMLIGNGASASDAPRVGGARARRAHHDPRHVPPLQGRGEDVRATRGAPRRRCAGDDARLVHPRAPDDDGHAVRRRDDRVHGAGPGRPAHARGADGPRLRGEGRRHALAPVGVAPGVRRLLVCALPQILYLLSRNVDFSGAAAPTASARTGTSFAAARAGATAACPATRSATTLAREHPSLGAPTRPSGFGMSIWRLVARSSRRYRRCSGRWCWASLLYMSWGERRTRRLYYLAAWFFAAVVDAGEGPGGVRPAHARDLRVPFASRPGEELLGAAERVVRELTQFEIVAACSSRWRWPCPGTWRCTCGTGSPFTDRLIFHDMFNRALHHVHDTNEGDDTSFRFYMWQLGYALFPWTGFAPLGLLWWLRRGTRGETPMRPTRPCCCACGVSSPSPFFRSWGPSFTTTSSRRCRRSRCSSASSSTTCSGKSMPAKGLSLGAYLVGLAGGISLLVLGITRMLPGSIWAPSPTGSSPIRPSPSGRSWWWRASPWRSPRSVSSATRARPPRARRPPSRPTTPTRRA